MRKERGGSAAAQEGRYLQQLRTVVVAVAARRGQDLFPLDRRRGIRVHGRGECGGAAFSRGGSIDALDDGINACVHGLLCLHRNGFRIIAP